jgi:hypothetical protein
MFTILMYTPSLSAIYVNHVIILVSLRKLFAQVNCDIGTTQQQFQVLDVLQLHDHSSSPSQLFLCSNAV